MVALPYSSIRTSRGYDNFLNALYMKAPRKVAELTIPPVKVIAVAGNEPPGSPQYQQAIAVLYGIGYGLKMGMKFGKLPKPPKYFDYRVGALESLWWSTKSELQVGDIQDSSTLRWLAYLMVPAFITKGLFKAAQQQATEKHPETPYSSGELLTIREGRAIQILHIGPYDQEKPTIEELHQYATAHRLAISGRHHEIYLSDPRRTAAAKLKTVIRLPVKPVSRN